jgi:hypothetical protein
MLALPHAAALALLSLIVAAPVAQRANPAAPAGGAPQGAPQARPQQPQIPQSTPGPISAEPPNIDFGVVRPGQEVNATIKLINPLDRPITITKATPSCQCTGVDIEGKQIPAKGHLEFPISIKMSSAPMKKIATLTILLEELKQVVVIKLESEIALAIRSKPPFIDVQQKLNMPSSGEVTITAADGKPFSVIAVHGKSPLFRGFDPSKDEPRVTYTLAYDLSAELAGAKVPPYFLIETDHPECPIVDIRVRHETTQIKPRLHVNGYRSSCGRIAPGSSGEFELEIEKMGSQRITGVRSLWPDAKVELIEQIADKHGNVTIRVKVTPPADFRGMLFFPVELSAGAVTTNQLVIGSVRE